jgi:protein ImuB
LSSEEAALLARLGLRRIGDLYRLPRAALAPRLGPRIARHLAEALGDEAEPLSPLAPVPSYLARRIFAEPIAARDDLAATLEALAQSLARDLAAAERGARRLELAIYRVDGSSERLAVGTSRASRDPAHFARLFAERLERFDPGFGIEVVTLAASRSEALGAHQEELQTSAAAARAAAETALPALVDRLNARLGPGCLWRPGPRESHLPEEAVAPQAPLARVDWQRRSPTEGPPPWAKGRPLRLLAHPEPVAVIALLPDHPPVQFRWRRLLHRVARAEGPERLLPEWWREEGPGAEGPPRDYFHVEDGEGRGYWLYRQAGRWYLHGLFG